MSTCLCKGLPYPCFRCKQAIDGDDYSETELQTCWRIYNTIQLHRKKRKNNSEERKTMRDIFENLRKKGTLTKETFVREGSYHLEKDDTTLMNFYNYLLQQGRLTFLRKKIRNRCFRCNLCEAKFGLPKHLRHHYKEHGLYDCESHIEKIMVSLNEDLNKFYITKRFRQSSLTSFFEIETKQSLKN